jgi:hypothetical protein
MQKWDFLRNGGSKVFYALGNSNLEKKILISLSSVMFAKLGKIDQMREISLKATKKLIEKCYIAKQSFQTIINKLVRN